MNKEKKTVLITGGNGMIGKHLTRQLLEAGFQVRWLVRRTLSTNDSVEMFRWSVTENYIDPKAFEGTDCIIHLAGENVGAARWTTKRKKAILESRISTSTLLIRGIKESGVEIETFIAASATGYYGGYVGDELKTETSENGKDFLAEVTREWEQAVEPVSLLVKRLVTFRIGVVLSHTGGALQKLALPVKLFLGSPVGTGNQMISWIHLEDLARVFRYAIDHEKISGTFNAVAPLPVSNAELTKALAKSMKRPLVLPNVPAFMLRLILGEMSEIVLLGCRVSCEKISKAGFEFRYPDIHSAVDSGN